MSQNNASTPKEAATKFRYVIIAIIFFITAINYADRSAFSVASSSAGKTLGLSPVEIGFILSAFSWAYVIAQLPGGLLIDRFGTKKVYIFAILGWSFFTFMQGTVGLLFGGAVFIAFFSLRFLVGLFEGPSFPGNAKIVRDWFPIHERGIATSIFNSAQYFSIVIFAPLMGYVAHNFGWRSVFFLMGLVGLVAVILFALNIKSPSEHKFVNKAELELIGSSEAEKSNTPTSKNKISLKDFGQLLNNRMLLGIYLTQYCINVLTYFFVTWFPIYLVKERGLDVLQAGFAASLPALFGLLGGLSGGLLTDRLMAKTKNLDKSRKMPLYIGMFLASSIILCAFTDSLLLVIVFMSIAFFGKGVASLGWAIISDVAPKSRFATAGSIFNMFGNIAGIITPIVIGYTIKMTDNFNLGLIYVGAHCLAAIVLMWLMVGQLKPVIIDENHAT